MSGIVYQLSGQLPCYVKINQVSQWSRKSSTAVSWCRWGHDWQAGEVVPPVFSKWAYWCPGYTFTSQRTSSLLGVRFHQLSPSQKWSAWKPPQQSVWREYYHQSVNLWQSEYVELVFKEKSIITSFSLAEDSMNAAPQESASFFPSSGLITLGKFNGTSLSENILKIL